MEIQEKKAPVSISRLFKVVFHRPILLSIVTLSTTAILTLGLTIVGKSNSTYQAQFTYTIPSMQDGRYLDGSQFIFNSILKKENLNKIKESNPLYNSININGLLSSKLLEIKKITEYSEVSKEVTSEYYSIVVPKSVFKNNNQAESFMYDVIYTPISHSISTQEKINYQNNIVNFDSAYSYKAQIDHLNNQYNLLIKNYEMLKTQYGNIFINNQQISDYIDEIESFYSSSQLKFLEIEIEQKGYVKEVDKESELLEIEKERLSQQYSYNEKKIDELKNTISFLVNESSSNTASLDLDSYNQKITELITENIDIQHEIDIINKKLSTLTKAPEAFVTKLNSIKNTLIDFTNKFSNNERFAISEYSQINFKNQKILTTSGPSIFKNGAVSLIMGFIIGCVINFILDYKYLYIEFPAKEKK